jgi:tetratricopeptide (TPR) repeat protein
MGRTLLSGLVICLMAGPGWGQSNERRNDNNVSDNRTVLGGGNELLSSGADAIRFGAYEEGIRLTKLGLENKAVAPHLRAAALSNLCAAYAALNVPDTAIEYCSQSLALNSGSWRAFSNRSLAYWLKGMYVEAVYDLDAAAAISPRAPQVLQIREMINEAGLKPRVVMEDHQ